ncbi:2-dehydropantoate 2-reductase, partial [Burkholderia thailandensis]|uniref:ketopantoate reductase family protein n=1 Tax=Burkholderia thailandensis TaxID=57975 RepID=UPI00217F079E
MKIAILGAGALGCAIGATLTEGGHETWLINRSPVHVGAMRRDGLRVDDASGTRYVRVHATTQAADIGVADLVIVLVKSFHTDAAIRGAQSLVGPDTAVLSLQNGLGHEDILADVVVPASTRLTRRLDVNPLRPPDTPSPSRRAPPLPSSARIPPSAPRRPPDLPLPRTPSLPHPALQSAARPSRIVP